jgi:hypothetical protein
MVATEDGGRSFHMYIGIGTVLLIIILLIILF